jgi:hypothetical protein
VTTGRFYMILRDGVSIATGPCSGALPATTLNCVDAPGDAASHTYAVRAINSCGGSITATGASAADVNNSAVLQMGRLTQTKSGNDLAVSWIAVTGAASYRVYRDATADPAGWTAPAVATGLTGTGWSDTNQLPGATSQFYSATVVNGCGVESPK